MRQVASRRVGHRTGSWLPRAVWIAVRRAAGETAFRAAWGSATIGASIAARTAAWVAARKALGMAAWKAVRMAVEGAIPGDIPPAAPGIVLGIRVSGRPTRLSLCSIMSCARREPLVDPGMAREWMVHSMEWMIPALEWMVHSMEWMIPALEWMVHRASGTLTSPQLTTLAPNLPSEAGRVRTGTRTRRTALAVARLRGNWRVREDRVGSCTPARQLRVREDRVGSCTPADGRQEPGGDVQRAIGWHNCVCTDSAGCAVLTGRDRSVRVSARARSSDG